MLQKPVYHSPQEYGALFTQVAYWRPYIEAVCARYGIPLHGLQAGMAGTNPVFVVDDGAAGVVIKFFESKLFDGERSFAHERAIYELLATADALPAPRLRAAGRLFTDGEWPYLILSRVPGVSWGEVSTQASRADALRLASWLGNCLRRFHNLPLAQSGLLQQSRPEFSEFIRDRRLACVARHQQWGRLPAHLLAELPNYLLPDELLIEPPARWCLIHADLNHDHVLGEFVDGCWQPRGIIDFGDARVGDWHYELVALHLGLFRTDRNLLRQFLTSYGGEATTSALFVRRAMSHTLLHEFDVLEAAPADIVATAPSLAALAEQLWQV